MFTLPYRLRLTLIRPIAMARTASTATATRRSTRNLKRETPDLAAVASPPPAKKIKAEPVTPSKPKLSTATIKEEPTTPSPVKKSVKKTAQTPEDKAAALQSKKLSSYAAYSSKTSPYPDFAHPTPDECRTAHKILAQLHGDRHRPTTVIAPKDSAGCGNSPTVLDALVRTILSQNTSDKNSSRAKRSMDQVYGGSDKWEAIVEGGQSKLQKAIESGGLSVVKSKVILSLLEQVHAQHGQYSLDHLFDEEDDEECMRQMLSYKGIGPKTASCVLLFCLGRSNFAVDTHVHRLTGLIGWRPPNASREQTYAHLDARIPDDEKYPLHILLIAHGKKCPECKAGGRAAGDCELRKAFRKGSKVKDEDFVKEEHEEEEMIKDEIKEEPEEEDIKEEQDA
ncbi:base excision DNA repair protein [Emericellopsis atlantica]|uniref:Base excision DNA repair protein n=1 Tax=Emericellopsis atlantica TaxID=2614577 RepID=A0A9P7ZJV7_9HYPO|nr:base excision DNA repair protein [Emericellopsis atlantica]KAG9253022.1 base excision DNA repair protein [Emericellopsis atlantica]